MKNFKLVAILIAIFSGNLMPKNAMASDPVLIREDRVWEYYRYINRDLSLFEWSLTRYKFNGTEERNGKTYHRWIATDRDFWNEPVDKNPDGSWNWQVQSEELGDCKALLREENGVVYMLLDSDKVVEYTFDNNSFSVRDTEGSEEVVLYDFNLGKEDTGRAYVTDIYFPQQFMDDNDIQSWEDVRGVITDIRVNSVSDENGMNRIEALNGAFKYNYILSEWNFPEDVIDKGLNLKFVKGIGNVGEGDMIDFGGCRFLNSRLVAGTLYDDLCLNNVYDLDGNVVYKGENKKVPHNENVSGSMFKEGRTWRYNAFGTKRHEVGGVSLGVYKVDFDIQAAEETEIDGVKYREFRTTGVSGEYVKYIYSEEDPEEKVGSEKVALDLKPGAPIYMREDNGRIYVRKPSAEPYALRWNVDGNEALVYDLNLTEGQSYDALNLDGEYREMTLEKRVRVLQAVAFLMTRSMSTDTRIHSNAWQRGMSVL